MTYLSRIRINPLRAESRTLLANPRAMHGAVMGGVADRPTEERVLWRLDADEPRRPMLYALTQSKPDWTHIVERAGWPDAEGEHAAVRDYVPLLAQIARGREFAFRLTANPVQNTRNPQKPSALQKTKTETRIQEQGQSDQPAAGERLPSFRMGHRTAHAQLAWFLQRTNRWGFEVPPATAASAAPGLSLPDQETEPAHDVRITARDRKSFTKAHKGKPVILHTATFEGRLRVTDPETLTAHLLAGIGPGKAYGCGLLTLAPLPSRR